MTDKDSNREPEEITPEQLKKECAKFRLTSTLSEKEYLKCRVTYKIELYGKLAKRQKLYYQILSIVSIVSAALVPVLVSQGYQIIAAYLGVLVTIFVSLEKLFHFREHWRNYDSIESFLRREQLFYQTRTGVYKDKPDDKIFDLFVTRIEEGIQNERQDTIDMRTSGSTD